MLVLPAATARADAEQEARELFRRGVEASASQRWAEAAEHFRRSSELVPKAATHFNLAVVYQQLGEPVAALRTLDVFAEMEPDEDLRLGAERLRTALWQVVVRYEVRVDVAGARFVVDGREVAGSGQSRRLVLPSGEHRLEVSAPGRATERVHLSGAPGATVQLRLELAELKPADVAPGARPVHHAPPPEKDGRRALRRNPWLWTGVGVAVAAAAVGVGFALRPERREEPMGGSTGIVW